LHAINKERRTYVKPGPFSKTHLCDPKAWSPEYIELLVTAFPDCNKEVVVDYFGGKLSFGAANALCNADIFSKSDFAEQVHTNRCHFALEFRP